MFKKVAIIGFGLIGSSLARVIRKNHIADEIVCIDSHADVCDRALALGLADSAGTAVVQGVGGCDFVVIAIPVGGYAGLALQLGQALERDCVVTDTGSVKKSVIDALRHHIPPQAHFVPAHPIAGTEKSGPDSGFAELFEGRWCILTPLPDTVLQAVEKVTKFWEACGCVIEIMDPARHDLILGITSHLPHLIAYTIVGTAADLETYTKDEVIKFSAGGFRDFTRLAASNPVMWRDILLHNKESVLDVLQRFTQDLTVLEKAIRDGDGSVLETMFDRTRHIRQEIIEAGQAAYYTATESSELSEDELGRQADSDFATLP